LPAGDTRLGGGVLVWAVEENVGKLITGGRKPLHLPGRLESLHDPLSFVVLVGGNSLPGGSGSGAGDA
jgi:hypothetical protein